MYVCMCVCVYVRLNIALAFAFCCCLNLLVCLRLSFYVFGEHVSMKREFVCICPC